MDRQSSLTKDDFSVWEIHPVTKAVIQRAKFLVEDSKRQWNSLLDATGMVDQQKLLVTYLDLRARKQALQSLVDLTFEDILDHNGI